eukprot:scaffold5828_cov168-Amphora_coffeaeformis.AAC.7
MTQHHATQIISVHHEAGQRGCLFVPFILTQLLEQFNNHIVGQIIPTGIHTKNTASKVVVNDIQDSVHVIIRSIVFRRHGGDQRNSLGRLRLVEAHAFGTRLKGHTYVLHLLLLLLRMVRCVCSVCIPFRLSAGAKGCEKFRLGFMFRGGSWVVCVIDYNRNRNGSSIFV